MMLHTTKFSRYVFSVCMILVLFLWVLCYAIGYMHPQGEAEALVFTDMLLFLLYLLSATWLVVLIVSVVMRIATLSNEQPRRLRKHIILLAALFVALGIAYWMGSGVPPASDRGECTSTFTLKSIDMLLYTAYLLTAVACAGVLLGLFGIFRHRSGNDA